MSDDASAVRARGLWEEPARVPVSFAPSGGVDFLGGSAIVTAPSDGAAVVVREALGRLPVEAVVDSARVRMVLPVTRVLGPAALAYVFLEGLRPVGAGALPVERLSAAHPDVRKLEQAAGPGDAGEAALEEVTSPVFVVRERGQVVAGAGYRVWPGRPPTSVC